MNSERVTIGLRVVVERGALVAGGEVVDVQHVPDRYAALRVLLDDGRTIGAHAGEVQPHVCEHDASLGCGCWLDDAGNVRRHAFRFVAGDRVSWGGVLHIKGRGVTGTVERGNGRGVGRMYVVWDEHCKSWAPTAFPDSLQIDHIAPSTEAAQ